MSLSAEFESLVHAIARANGHPSPADYVALVKAEFECDVPQEPAPAQPTETPVQPEAEPVQIADEAHSAVEEVRQEGT